MTKPKQALSSLPIAIRLEDVAIDQKLAAMNIDKTDRAIIIAKTRQETLQVSQIGRLVILLPHLCAMFGLPKLDKLPEDYYRIIGAMLRDMTPSDLQSAKARDKWLRQATGQMIFDLNDRSIAPDEIHNFYLATLPPPKQVKRLLPAAGHSNGAASNGHATRNGHSNGHSRWAIPQSVPAKRVIVLDGGAPRRKISDYMAEPARQEIFRNASACIDAIWPQPTPAYRSHAIALILMGLPVDEIQHILTKLYHKQFFMMEPNSFYLFLYRAQNELLSSRDKKISVSKLQSWAKDKKVCYLDLLGAAIHIKLRNIPEADSAGLHWPGTLPGFAPEYKTLYREAEPHILVSTDSPQQEIQTPAPVAPAIAADAIDIQILKRWILKKIKDSGKYSDSIGRVVAGLIADGSMIYTYVRHEDPEIDTPEKVAECFRSVMREVFDLAVQFKPIEKNKMETRNNQDSDISWVLRPQLNKVRGDLWRQFCASGIDIAALGSNRTFFRSEIERTAR